MLREIWEKVPSGDFEGDVASSSLAYVKSGPADADDARRAGLLNQCNHC